MSMDNEYGALSFRRKRVFLGVTRIFRIRAGMRNFYLRN